MIIGRSTLSWFIRNHSFQKGLPICSQQLNENQTKHHKKPYLQLENKLTYVISVVENAVITVEY